MDSAIKKEIAVEWKSGPLQGQVRVSDGRLLAMEIVTRSRLRRWRSILKH